MEQLIERIAKAPFGLKLGVVVAALAVITLANLFLVGVPPPRSINDIEARKTRGLAELNKLNAEYIEKQSIANDLNRFRRERELLEQRLNEALSELPEQKNIDELLQAFQDRAQKSGLEIASIEPKEQVISGFYAKIPIIMQVDGNYHEIATFFDALGRLRRIVNVSDIVFDKPRTTNGKLLISSKFTATTFMFVDPKIAAEAAAKAKAKGGK
ncbi:MAG TPA: type 4a pilus biogenesis protein PilO [Anaeromyxobacter sp.]|nr:type 4a pilus biogenesis protein PilO [Anaeromyxobacter sp.]